MSFHIRPREKVGIVGRTGAGKSTLLTTLFRLVEISSGQIKIDGVDIGGVALQWLRSRLAIIPQDPVLFTGTGQCTSVICLHRVEMDDVLLLRLIGLPRRSPRRAVRDNLDAWHQYDDLSIWEALEMVQLGDVVRGLDGQLQASVGENGLGFSVGERQLLCFARALLRRQRILLMDEATASCDFETDALIQTTVRERFADCTVITIAHRLQTIMDNDRVMVLDAGRLVEFGTPWELLQHADGHFASLVEETGAAASHLREIAHRVHVNCAAVNGGGQ